MTIAASTGTTDDRESPESGDPGDDRSRRRDPERQKPANTAPDAVKDPNEKTDGKPGVPPGAGDRGGEADPGGG